MMKPLSFQWLACSVLIAWALASPAQDGPYVPCANCDARTFQPYPDSGPWANTDQTGSGFLLNVQNGILAGFYFGYDTEGRPEWLLFNGALEPNEDDGEILWQLEAPLSRFSGGSCASCEYAPPQSQTSVGTVKLKFFQRNHASFQIDSNAEQYMVPLLFGSAGYERFGEHANYLVPELGGEGENSAPWIIYYSKGAIWRDTFFSSVIVHLRSSQLKFSEALGDYVEYRSIEEFSLADPPPRIVNIECFDSSGSGDNLCRVFFHYIPYSDVFHMPLANLSANSFFAENEDGDTLVGFRMRYD